MIVQRMHGEPGHDYHLAEHSTQATHTRQEGGSGPVVIHERDLAWPLLICIMIEYIDMMKV